MPFYYDYSKSHDNGFLRFVRRIYHPLGFNRGYNFPLWIILAGAMFGFGCARVEYLDINGIFKKSKIIPGDWEYFGAGHYYVGIVLHLATVIPACFLIPWQFLPIIRRKALWFHRINGYLLVILLVLGIVGALMIARRSLGGSLSTQAMIGIAAVYILVSLLMAYYNIKQLQIDQHRAWMLRAWVVAGFIITQRLIQLIVIQIISRIGDYRFPMACHTIEFITMNAIGQSLAPQYAACREDPINGWAAVTADFAGGPQGFQVEKIGATVDITFGMTATIAFFIHAVAVEIYLKLTPAESDRLRQVSYEKQVARGRRRPGNSGLTVDMWGDANPWKPESKESNLVGESSGESVFEERARAQKPRQMV